MIVIYTQDNTIIRENIEEARADLIGLYGEKLGTEAYIKLKNCRIGYSYRKNGGPLVKVVTKEQATKICEEERAIGMI